jgi:hypothetical protein
MKRLFHPHIAAPAEILREICEDAVIEVAEADGGIRGRESSLVALFGEAHEA